MAKHFDYQTSINYISAIGEKSKFIGEIIEANNDDVDAKLTASLGKTVMLIEDPMEKLGQGSGERTTFTLSFNVLRFASKKSPTYDLKTTKNSCRAIMFKILAYLNNKMLEGEIPTLSLNSFKLHPVDFYEIGWHGYRATFELTSPITLAFDEDDWDL